LDSTLKLNYGAPPHPLVRFTGRTHVPVKTREEAREMKKTGGRRQWNEGRDGDRARRDRMEGRAEGTTTAGHRHYCGCSCCCPAAAGAAASAAVQLIW